MPRSAKAHAKSAASSAGSSRAFRTLARGGFVASGVVHVIVGVLAISLAFTGRGEADQASALAAVTSVPLGAVALWLLAALLFALGIMRGINGFIAEHTDDKKKWAERLGEWGKGGVYVALGVTAVSVALGNRSDGDESAAQVSRGVLDLPGGPVLLGIAGLAIAVGGVSFVVIGIRRRFLEKLDLPVGGRGRAIAWLGVAGYIAKGVAIAVVGVLLASAAWQNDPESAGALDTAIQTLRDLPGGAVIVCGVGAGFLAYGVFMGARARYSNEV